MKQQPDNRNTSAHSRGIVWPEAGSGENIRWMPLIRSALLILSRKANRLMLYGAAAVARFVKDGTTA
ncbi:hypothetical protein Rleg2_6313 (plasmid) [Rhizobium leguminosarum bv. trifolii WSM2304]|uniref:Uncharacterized protein n=1 Tax=Rhizobium leguminosarum bv. trifolii (strain WSM2304) TaxID=395492 RepID=A0ABF7QZR5_RHILW|nr:hypothetical protein Rleg2_6313 [Rhizobium leguminosarum bv. trifolii WSM2304]